MKFHILAAVLFLSSFLNAQTYISSIGGTPVQGSIMSLTYNFSASGQSSTQLQVTFNTGSGDVVNVYHLSDNPADDTVNIVVPSNAMSVWVEEKHGVSDPWASAVDI